MNRFVFCAILLVASMRVCPPPLSAAEQDERNLLFQLILENNIDKTKDLLRSGAAFPDPGTWPYSVEGRIADLIKTDDEFARLAVPAGLSLDRKISSTYPIIDALESDSLDRLKLYVELGADVNLEGWFESPLLVAETSARRNTYDFLVSNGARFRESELWQFEDDCFKACETGDLDRLRQLFSGGVVFDITDYTGNSLLARAVQSGRLEVVRYLMENGADPTVENEEGHTLLMLAVWNGHEAVANYLIEKGLDLHARSNNGRTALLLATDAMSRNEPEEQGPHLRVITTLVDKGANVNSTDTNGRAPIHFAVESGNIEAVEFLLNRGADLRSEDGLPLRLVQTARRNGSHEIVSILLYHAAGLANRGFPEDWALDHAYRPLERKQADVESPDQRPPPPPGDLQQLFDSEIENISISPDGRHGLIDSYSKLHLIDLETGRELWNANVDSRKTSRFTPDGEYILGTSGHVAFLMDVETGNVVRRFAGHKGSIDRMILSQDGRYLATASGDDDTVRLWDYPTGDELKRFSLEGADKFLGRNSFNFRFSPDAKYLLLRGGKNRKLFDLHSFKKAWEKRDNGRSLFLPDGSFLLTGDRNGFFLEQVETGDVLCSLDGSWVSHLSISPDSRFLVTGENIYDLKTALTNQTLETPSFNIEDSSHRNAVVFSPDSKSILTGVSSPAGHDGKGRAATILRELPKGNEISRFHGHAGGVTSAAFIPRSRFLLTGGSDRTIKLWDLKTGRIVPPQLKATPVQGPRLVASVGHSDSVSSFALAPDEEHFITGGKDGVAILWDSATGREIRRFEGHEGDIVDIAVSPDLRTLATATKQGVVRVFGLVSGELLHRFFISASSLAYTEDGLKLVAGKNHEEISIWDLTTGERLTEHGTPENYTLSSDTFASNGRSFIGPAAHTQVGEKSGETGDVILGTVGENGGYHLDVLAGHNDFLTSAVLGDSGRIGVTGGFDGSIVIWDMEKKKKMHEIPPQTVKITIDGKSKEIARSAGDLCLSPDETTFLEFHFDRINVWDVETGHLLRHKKIDYSEASGVFSPNKINFTKDGRHFIVAGDKGRVITYDFDTLNESQNLATLGNVGAVSSVAFSNKGDKLLVGSQGRAGKSVAQVWSMRTGEEKQRIDGTFVEDYDPDQGPFRESPHMPLDTRASFTPDGSGILTQNERAARLTYPDRNKALLLPQMEGDAPNGMAISPDGRFAVLAEGYNVRLWDLAAETELAEFSWKYAKNDAPFILMGDAISNVAISPDSSLVAIASRSSLNPIMIWDVALRRKQLSFGKNVPQAVSLAFSPDGTILATGHQGDHAIRLWEVKSGKLIKKINGHTDTVTALRFLPGSGRTTLLSGSKDGTARLWDVETGRELRRFSGDNGEVSSVALSPDGAHLITGHANGSALLWRTDNEQWLARLISFLDGGWVVVDPYGRYDSDNPGHMPGLSWIMADAPLTPLPVEIFMREYYEPRLLSRILAGEQFDSISDLADLNRTQPKVAIAEVSRNAAETDRVSVTVRVANVAKKIPGKDGTPMEQESGAYDLRLFRDGQLVGSFPDEGGKIEMDQANGMRELTFDNIKLPSRSENDKVTFSAYLFNEDRVKSSTAEHDFPIEKSASQRKRRAYIIAIGVNAYENPSWDLRYAVSDALAIDAVVKKQLEKTGVFDEIISIPLISKYNSKEPGKKVLEANPVTADMVKAVINRLAGQKSESDALLHTIPNADKLQEASPDDLLLITYSGHGLTDDSRQFHLFPYDIGKGTTRVVDDELLEQTIASDDLSRWLRDVDAGEMLMIIDACNSAASVEGKGFKPGPMGSRGLGQLAYDKGMRILTASQAESVALESDLIRHGALTYALIREGLESYQADREPEDGQIFAGEWLLFGLERVPSLYSEIRSGAVKQAGRGTVIPLNPGNKTTRKANVQQPGLFDFKKTGEKTLISTGTASDE